MEFRCGRLLLLLLSSIFLVCTVLLLRRVIIHTEANTAILDTYMLNVFNDWEDCIREEFNKYDGDQTCSQFWRNGWESVNGCESAVGVVKATRMMNGEDDKWHILSRPEHRSLPTHIVTLGVGRNMGGEESMKTLIAGPTTFVGADPVEDVNRAMYERLVRFVHTAVGGREGESVTQQVLLDETGPYVARNASQVELSSFLADHVPDRMVDQLMVDIEGAEFGILPAFVKGGALDQKHIVVCQINMEMLYPKEADRRLVRDWFFRLLADGRYFFGKMQKLRSHERPLPVYDHVRVFLYNRQHPYCLHRYITQFFPPLVTPHTR